MITFSNEKNVNNIADMETLDVSELGEMKYCRCENKI